MRAHKLCAVQWTGRVAGASLRSRGRVVGKRSEHQLCMAVVLLSTKKPAATSKSNAKTPVTPGLAMKCVQPNKLIDKASALSAAAWSELLGGIHDQAGQALHRTSPQAPRR